MSESGTAYGARYDGGTVVEVLEYAAGDLYLAAMGEGNPLSASDDVRAAIPRAEAMERVVEAAKAWRAGSTAATDQGLVGALNEQLAASTPPRRGDEG